MMRERLAQLLRSKSCWNNDCPEGGCEKCDYIGINDETAEQIADYLIANGVVVMPCKVGDVIYETDGIRIYESIIRKVIYETKGIAFDESAIGKSVFLSRDDAERALKGVIDKFVGGKDKGGAE